MKRHHNYGKDDRGKYVAGKMALGQSNSFSDHGIRLQIGKLKTREISRVSFCLIFSIIL